MANKGFQGRVLLYNYSRFSQYDIKRKGWALALRLGSNFTEILLKIFFKCFTGLSMVGQDFFFGESLFRKSASQGRLRILANPRYIPRSLLDYIIHHYWCPAWSTLKLLLLHCLHGVRVISRE